MRSFPTVFVAFLVVGFASVSQATVVHVPTDSPTIQGGIDIAAHGDTVLVHPGTYVENIDFFGKAIVVLSACGPDSTVIDGNQAGSVVSFVSGEGSDSVIEGFTITNGSGTYFDDYWEYGGGGIYCHGSGPTIQYNRITGNAATNGGGIAAILSSSAVITHNLIFGNSANTAPDRMGGGGGIVSGWDSDLRVSYNEIYDNYSNMAGGGIVFGFDCNPEVKNNTIRNNVANVYGGGIQIYSYTTGTFENNIVMGNASLGYNGAGGISCRVGSSPTINNNLVCGNTAVTYGGGIRCFEGASPTITNNIIFGNQADVSGGGIECDSGASATITNTILWGNSAPAGTEMWIGPRGGSPAVLSIGYSDVEGGIASVFVYPGSTLDWGAGMLDEDPSFRDAGAQDFHLMAIDCGYLLDSACIDAGDPAVTDSLLDCSHGLGVPRSDIGAYGGRGDGPVTAVSGGESWVPKTIQLSQNYPNPFNPLTTIAYALEEQSIVTLRVFDVAGRLVDVLVKRERQPAGTHTVSWTGRDAHGRSMSSGVYFCRLEAGSLTQTRRMVLIR